MPRFDYDKLLANVSITEVAQRLGMQLRAETDTRFKALCPFHDDKTPSLLVDASREPGRRQHFHCFACGAHGDAIDLVKSRLNIGFKEAVNWLSIGTSDSTVARSSGLGRARTVEERDGGTGLALAYEMYRRGSNAGRLDEWIAMRSLDATTIRRAGFVHATTNFLSSRLDAEKDRSRKRERAGLLEEAHLVRKFFPGVANALHLKLHQGDDGSTKYGDFFVGERIVFPLYDAKGQLVGLGGRSSGDAVGSSSPKYQFTRGFAKSRMLYRAERAFGRIRQGVEHSGNERRLFICEGFLDALRLEGFGVDAVAVMGNSLSDHQTQLIKELRDSLPGQVATLTVIVCFDRDEAGLRGSADACLKLLAAGIDCRFCYPAEEQLKVAGVQVEHAKDPNDYLAELSPDIARKLLSQCTYSPVAAVLALAFGTTADETLTDAAWSSAPRSRRMRAFMRTSHQLRKVVGSNLASLVGDANRSLVAPDTVQALRDWIAHLAEAKAETHRSLSEEFLNDAQARLNHARLLAYMGSKRGELRCDEPRWERLDVAATAFNALLVDRLASTHAEPIGPYDAVWVPREFGGPEPRLKMMPKPEDLTIQQYLLNEILTERWDHSANSDPAFSKSIPAVRFYREERRTVTTGFDSDGKGSWTELGGRTLSFAYQIDMDVVDGRQPASSQGMYRPFHECWLDYMSSISRQVSEIGYVYAVRLDVKRYYDRLRRYVVRDSLQARLERAIESVTGDTPGFAELLGMSVSTPLAADKTTAILERIDEQLFGVTYMRPDTGFEEKSDPTRGIPQGPVLSAWIGSIALFPLDQEANKLIERYNTEKTRVGYARYVDDIVLLADSPAVLTEMRECIDQRARSLELTLLAKAEEIPPMSAEDFSIYMNQGRALAASGPAWEPPLVGDGESGWDFWSVTPTTDRQSALQLLHNVELYKAPASSILQTVRTAMQAPDLRASELPKAARLLWYAIASESEGGTSDASAAEVRARFLTLWDESARGASWRLLPEKHSWESPLLFGLEGLEHLLDTKTQDVRELTAQENVVRRSRIAWLAKLVLSVGFASAFNEAQSGPNYQRNARFELLVWKAKRATGQGESLTIRSEAERARLVQAWQPFDWMHEAVALLATTSSSDEDPLKPFLEPFSNKVSAGAQNSVAARLFRELLPAQSEKRVDSQGHTPPTDSSEADFAALALQTLASVVPRDKVLARLGARPKLLTSIGSSTISSMLLPPLPGVRVRRLFSCLIDGPGAGSDVVARGLEVTELGDSNDDYPTLVGADANSVLRSIELGWKGEQTAGGVLRRLSAPFLANDFLRLRSSTDSMGSTLKVGDLKAAARLYRAIVAVVRHFASEHPDLELVPAWPYLAMNQDGDHYFVIGEGVSRAELGNRAFVRDGGRALRTIEVPIYEASLWRVGAAVSDFIGLHDDVAKFSNANSEVTLDAAALSNPARYVLRSQLRKLRGAFADSRISLRSGSASRLPSTIERSLRLLETFPDETTLSISQIVHLLAIETESAAMFLSFRESWSGVDGVVFLKELTERLIMRLPLSVSTDLAVVANDTAGLRRDLWGVLCFSRQLHAQHGLSDISQELAWRALRAGSVCAAISVALDGLIAAFRSHGSYEANPAFDFPVEWNVAASTRSSASVDTGDESAPRPGRHVSRRMGLVEQLRSVMHHLGHRVRRETTSPGRLSDDLYRLLETLTRRVAQAEYSCEQTDSVPEWPFECVSAQALDLLNLDLLELMVDVVRQLDAELGFEVVLARESSNGYNAQTRRFVDSRNRSSEVTPWMISQFPRHAKHIEEVIEEGRVLRVWSETYDRESGRLLSVSALGEPFASIAIDKSTIERSPIDESSVVVTATEIVPSAEQVVRGPSEDELLSALGDIADTIHAAAVGEGAAGDGLGDSETSGAPLIHRRSSKPSVPIADSVGTDSDHPTIDRRVFRLRQIENWQKRGRKRGGHIRVALLQTSLDLTYIHPMIEACPSNWKPFCNELGASLTKFLPPTEAYEMLVKAAAESGSEHHWDARGNEAVSLMSWAEHRRRRILVRVIASCEAFGVDLLVLPEYSVRRETVDWLRGHLAKKHVAVLAGTYMEYRQSPPHRNMTAQMTLLWPLPSDVARQMMTGAVRRSSGLKQSSDSLERGLVLEFARAKKYRSIPLGELFRPLGAALAPLFLPEQLAAQIQEQTGWEPSVSAVSSLLSQTRLPLKHVLELVCSEVFLVSSPANYLHIADDYVDVRRRFGEPGETDEVEKDLRELAKHLSITGDGSCTRRSILAIPAATSRSADYWIAGQACQLAAGTTSVFANGVGADAIGGSCFVGKDSWKTRHLSAGYIAAITPYHGWSKGIYYNDENDALSRCDEAVVIADIDPYNMLEGKPRPQTMPIPLQLVAYLPIVECVDLHATESVLLKSCGLPPAAARSDRVTRSPRDEGKFWQCVREAISSSTEASFGQLWKHFPDSDSVAARAAAFWRNGAIQPSGGAHGSNSFGAPALHDWIDVSLTLSSSEMLPRIEVPSWMK